ncbi:SDR family oxidoreductase [Aspergillus saccharolyticus JOP 1030-1]|uniref:Putative short-chain oxidoreductase n=1 Tax=Aspergillus saccharolyticus JOP 1030-1 TaxID=1450539 RepID=A0A318ZDH2_9EURO|nr:putative short-chain oxidoreductase [Aspergillus saccharolyticus JOP 1030-1]PYH44627.1 putative short-chain oxidoreductase [Aspergillus saccharolyticus JOP 1030-1]
MSQVYLITGCSSGLGHELARQALQRGHKVIATARDLDKLSALQKLGAATLALDVTAPQSELNRTVTAALGIYGSIDVLVNNAGYTLFGSVEDLSYEECLREFQTNVFGPIGVTRAMLPHFRRRNGGTVVNIGSLCAWETYPGAGAYSASKAAIRYFTEALSQETSSTGIRTLLVEPGQFRTELLNPGKSTFIETDIPQYRDVIPASFAAFRNIHGKQRGDTSKAVARILDVVHGENEASGREWPGELVLGPDAVEAIRSKCQRTLKRLNEWQDFSSETDAECS